jgi:hypothetical protein
MQLWAEASSCLSTLALPACLPACSLSSAELYDLQDPEGVAQTTVSLLSEKAPEQRLQEFLDHKVAGVRAVVDALQVGLGAGPAATTCWAQLHVKLYMAARLAGRGWL